jgi:hypothetical protein
MGSGLTEQAKLKSYKFAIPFVGEIEWEPDESQRRAAWELYVELATRVGVQALDLDQGCVREAMNSLYSLFGTTRDILRRAGPGVGASRATVGGIALIVLNSGLRPYLSKWHPALQAHEVLRPPTTSPRDWERTWEKEPALRGELEALRGRLEEYGRVLAKMAGVEI